MVSPFVATNWVHVSENTLSASSFSGFNPLAFFSTWIEASGEEVQGSFNYCTYFCGEAQNTNVWEF